MFADFPTMVRLREIANERCEPVVGVAPPTHRGPLGIDLACAHRSYPEQYADAVSWDPVSYTHLTLPTIYSV